MLRRVMCARRIYVCIATMPQVMQTVVNMMTSTVFIDVIHVTFYYTLFWHSAISTHNKFNTFTGSESMTNRFVLVQHHHEWRVLMRSHGTACTSVLCTSLSHHGCVHVRGTCTRLFILYAGMLMQSFIHAGMLNAVNACTHLTNENVFSVHT